VTAGGRQRTWTFPAVGGTIWDDLDLDRPWHDPAHAADREQDLQLRAALLAERFGDPAQLAREAGRRTPPPPPRRRPRDTDLMRAERRRTLNAALPGDYHRFVPPTYPKESPDGQPDRPAARRAA
jgi:hypothetical protein